MFLIVRFGFAARPTNIRKYNRQRRDLTIGKFRIIRNETFPCEALMEEGAQKMELDDETKMEMFKAEGGVYLPGYMARTLDEAKKNFRHMVAGVPTERRPGVSF